MGLEKLLEQRLEKKKNLSTSEYDKLGLYGEGYCEIEDDEDDEDEEDEEDW